MLSVTAWSKCARRHRVIAFPAVYLGVAYLFWLPVLLAGSPVWSLPSLAWFLAGGSSPLVAGLLLAWLDGGREGLAGLWRRLVDRRRVAGRWWLGILLFWLLFDVAMAALAVTLGIADSPLSPNLALLRQPEQLLFLLLLCFVFPAAEEVGLRGYYLDALQRALSPLRAAILNGCVWALWHAPFVFFPGYYAHTSFDPDLSWWLPLIVCHTLLIAAVYNGTNRSILAVLVFHGMMNFTGEWLRISSAMYPFMLYGSIVAAVFAALYLQRVRPSGR